MTRAPARRPAPPVVKFYFSYRSPYAWFATVRLPRLLEGLPVTVLYRPVWEPEPALQERLAPYDLVWAFNQPAAARRRYTFEDARRFARAYGLPMRWPIDRDPEWSPPHLALLHAREHGRERDFHAAVFAARFERAENVMELEVLTRIAEDVGLDPEELRRAVTDGRYDDAVVRCYQEAADDAVFGWPFFVYGRQKFWGNDRLEWLVEAIRADHGDAARMDATTAAGLAEGTVGG